MTDIKEPQKVPNIDPPIKKKGFIGKLREKAEDKEEQLAIFSTFVRLGILVWSGGILTLAYIKLPPALGIPEQKLDPTFIASVFTGVLATFGVQASKKNGAAAGGGPRARAAGATAQVRLGARRAAGHECGRGCRPGRFRRGRRQRGRRADSTT